MANPNSREVRSIPGRLCADPTDLSTAYPHGGTGLGNTRDMIFRPGQSNRPIIAEDFGNSVVEAFHTGDQPVFAAIMRDLDDDMLQKIFVQTAAGSVSGNQVVSRDSTVRAGTLLSDNSFKLCFSPLDTTKDDFILLYRAIPLIEETAEIQLTTQDDVSIAVMFMGIRDATGRFFAMGKQEDLTL